MTTADKIAKLKSLNLPNNAKEALKKIETAIASDNKATKEKGETYLNNLWNQVKKVAAEKQSEKKDKKVPVSKVEPKPADFKEKEEKVEINKEAKKINDKVEDALENDPLLKNYNRKTSVYRDAGRQALPAGKRVSQKGWKNQYGKSKGGRVYYENRENRSDRKAPNFASGYPYLKEGGYIHRAEGGYTGREYEVSIFRDGKEIWSKYYPDENSALTYAMMKSPMLKKGESIVVTKEKVKILYSSSNDKLAKGGKISSGATNPNHFYRVYVYRGGEGADDQYEVDTLKEAKAVSQMGEHSEIYLVHKGKEMSVMAKGGKIKSTFKYYKVPNENLWAIQECNPSNKDDFGGECVVIRNKRSEKEAIAEVERLNKLGHHDYYDKGGYMANGGKIKRTDQKKYKLGLDRIKEHIVYNFNKTPEEAEEIINKHRWIVDKDFERNVRYNVTAYKLIITEKTPKGGKMLNFYDGKTPREVWSSWTIPQRIHFLTDHREEINDERKKYNYDKLTDYNIIDYANYTYDEWFWGIAEVLKNHIKEGQYAKGGYMAKGGYVVVGEKDGNWTIVSRPTDMATAKELLNHTNFPRGEVGKVVSVEDAKNHKQVIGKEYLAKGDYMADGGYIAKRNIREVMIKMPDGGSKAIYPKDFLDGIHLYAKGGKIPKGYKYIKRADIEYAMTDMGEKKKPSNGFWVKESALTGATRGSGVVVQSEIQKRINEYKSSALSPSRKKQNLGEEVEQIVKDNREEIDKKVDDKEIVPLIVSFCKVNEILKDKYADEDSVIEQLGYPKYDIYPYFLTAVRETNGLKLLPKPSQRKVLSQGDLAKQDVVKKVLKTFVSSDNYRDRLNHPYQDGDLLVATDAHKMIVLENPDGNTGKDDFVLLKSTDVKPSEKFPDWKMVWPKSNDIKVEVGVMELLNALYAQKKYKLANRNRFMFYDAKRDLSWVFDVDLLYDTIKSIKDLGNTGSITFYFPEETSRATIIKGSDRSGYKKLGISDAELFKNWAVLIMGVRELPSESLMRYSIDQEKVVVDTFKMYGKGGYMEYAKGGMTGKQQTLFAKGGHIGFDALAAKVAKRYEGKKVPAKYQDEYGKTYDKEEAKEVGDKVAAKVYRQQQGKMANGGETTKRYFLSEVDGDGYTYIMDSKTNKKVPDTTFQRSDIQGYGKLKNKFLKTRQKYSSEWTTKDATHIINILNGDYADGGELKMGIKQEAKEHRLSKKEATKVAKDHLAEDDHYYTKLKAAGLAEGGEIPNRKLPHKLSKYFTKPAGTQEVEMDKLMPIRAREKGIANAEKYMYYAYKGEMEKRKPITIQRAGRGKFKIIDGNSTYAVAKKNGWKTIWATIEMNPRHQERAKKSVLSIAKEIRKEGEKWQDAVKRATAMNKAK